MKTHRILPVLTLLVIAVVTFIFAIQLPGLQIDNEVTNFIPEKDPSRLALEAMEDQYGGALVMDLVVIDSYGPILTGENLLLLDRITREVEEIPGVRTVQSLSNTDYISGADGTLTVLPMAKDSLDQMIPAEEMRTRINSWNLYDRMLLSEDGHSTQIGITLVKDLGVEEREYIFTSVQDVVASILPEGYKSYLAGLPATTLQITVDMRKDLMLLIPFVVFLLIGILYLSFRNLGGVVLPLLNVVVSTVWTLGLMAWTNNPISLLGSVIPVLMIAVGSAYGIHIVSHYMDERRYLIDGDKEGQRKAVLHTLKIVGIPVAMAGITTIVGFGSLVISTVVPMRIFGIFTAFGVFSALLVSLTLIPSLLLLHPARASGAKEEKHCPSMLLDRLAGLSQRRKGWLIGVSLLLVAGAGYYIPRIKVDNNIVDYFKSSTEVQQSDRFIRENFAGTNSFSILISGEEKGSLTHPEILLFMDNMKGWMTEEFPQISKVISYSDFIKRINQVLHEDSPGRISLTGIPASQSSDSGFSDSGFSDSGFSDSGFSDSGFSDSGFSDSGSDSSFFASEDGVYSTSEETVVTGETSPLMDALWNAWLTDPENFMEDLARATNHKGMDYLEIPADPEKYKLESQEDLASLISQYLLLYSGSLTDWSNEALEPSQARMSVQLTVNGSSDTDKLIPYLQQYVDRNLPEGYSVKFAGTALVMSSLTHQIVDSAVKSILISILLVFIILAITYRSPLAGLIGIVPLTLTVLVNFGLMGLAGIKMDISTAMVGCIGIGIGIDYTIHFLSSYVHHYKNSGSIEEITLNAMHSSGKAILFNAASVAAGFAVLILSRFNPLMYFGALIVLTMGVSSLSSLTLLPLILNGIKPRFLAKMHQLEEVKSSSQNSKEGEIA